MIVKFYHYKYDPLNNHTLEVSIIFSLYEDSEKNLWIGTSWTLFRYDRANDKFIRHSFNNSGKEKMIENAVLSITEDTQKKLWFSAGTVICCAGPDRKDIKIYSDKLNLSTTSSVCVDKSGII